jgi:hypothetical protein
MRMVAFYCLEAFTPLPRRHDISSRALQEGTLVPSYVVVIFDNENRDIS